jgi:predicted SAM-dependent methyltransferase
MKEFIKSLLLRRIVRFISDLLSEIKGTYNAIYYRGKGVLCPCCGKTFRSFTDLDVGNIITVNKSRYLDFIENTRCPYCRSLSRHRIACYHFNEIKDKLPLPSSSKNYGILMFSAERSIKKWFTRNGYRYTTADLIGRTPDINVDIQKTPFPDESWTLIICNHVLEHVTDYRLALKELKRILRTDGILELTVPTDRNLKTTYEDAAAITAKQRIDMFGQSDHLRIFGNDLQQILVDVGFSVEVIDGNNLPSSIRPTIGPANYDDNRVYFCKKIK